MSVLLTFGLSAMYPSPRLLIACALVAAAGVAQATETCEALQSRIEANIASKGVTDFSVTVVDAAADAPGQVVGSCGNGEKKIMYARGVAPAPAMAPAPAPAPAHAPAAAAPTASKPAAAPKPGKNQGILTECKDGTVSLGGDCKP